MAIKFGAVALLALVGAALAFINHGSTREGVPGHCFIALDLMQYAPRAPTEHFDAKAYLAQCAADHQ